MMPCYLFLVGKKSTAEGGGREGGRERGKEEALERKRKEKQYFFRWLEHELLLHFKGL